MQSDLLKFHFYLPKINVYLTQMQLDDFISNAKRIRKFIIHFILIRSEL